MNGQDLIASVFGKPLLATDNRVADSCKLSRPDTALV